ncbi:MAG: HAD family hydrolase [Cyanobacteria bacterium J06635_15]
MNRHRALFLDRDGVVNQDRKYVYRPEQIEFVEGIFDLCRHARQLSNLLFIVTNQSGIGRGYYTEADFYQLTGWMLSVFEEQACPIDQVYYCPYHPTAGIGKYQRESNWRKPQPGMILAAAQAFNLDLSSSVLVGDQYRDIAAGQAAGVGCNILYARAALPASDVVPTATVAGLTDIQNYLTDAANWATK